VGVQEPEQPHPVVLARLPQHPPTTFCTSSCSSCTRIPASVKVSSKSPVRTNARVANMAMRRCHHRGERASR
jgi:hypothetical protein